ncbi:hypothetical protein N7456_007389 [Penicillium angulare]|uniref:NACHT domain-containing protein n=1 Tax=Penicillium angulare TaxID=116970 RepID=A0A9W9FAK4_9EURO|nr:hypothetical protein N7456_007389 [Penicillium angulare]
MQLPRIIVTDSQRWGFGPVGLYECYSECLSFNDRHSLSFAIQDMEGHTTMSVSDSGSDTVLLEAGDVQDFNPDNILPLPASELAKIIKWLQPTPYAFERGEYARHRASHLLGTGTWLTSTQVYQQWHSGENGLLLIKGIPGSGKSVMAAFIIKKLQEENRPVIYFFFRQIIEANHKPIVALRDWLCQVLDYSPPLQAKLHKYVEGGRSLDDLSPDDLWSDLMMALADLPKAYCVTDALDEMDPGNDSFLKKLVDFGQWRPKNVKVLMTSRPIARLETSLRPYSIPQLRLEENLVDLDIASYVQHRLHGSSIPEEYWRAIQEAVPGRANGIFLYAKMSMDVFSEPGVDVQEAFKALPMDLNVMYNELLLEHARRSNVPSKLQILILQFVTHATRPLRLLELAEMLNTHSECNRALKETKALVRTACGPLLEVLPDETVSVIHHTLTEFLKGSTRSAVPENSDYPIFEPGPTNLHLAIECLHYMRSGCLDDIIPGELILTRRLGVRDPKEKKIEELRLQFPFLEYATKNWYKHARLAEASDENVEVLHQALDVFFAETHRYNAWLFLAWPGSNLDGIAPIHVAARTGLSRFAEYILSKGKVVGPMSPILPISWAASYNHGNVIRVLVDHGADPDAELGEGRKPMHLAAKSNNVDAIKALIAAGVSPLTPKTKNDTPIRGGCVVGMVGPVTIGHTPLMYACHAGHLETVVEFLPCLTNPEDIYQALHWAAEKGRSSIVKLILQQPGIDVNAKRQGNTALLLACKSADLNTIRILIKAGADPTVVYQAVKTDEGPSSNSHSSTDNLQKETTNLNDRGYTVLHVLCKNSVYGEQARSEATECVKILLQAGADVHAKNTKGLTALHYAFQSSIGWMKPLLDAGADPTMEDDNGDTVLHLSSSFESEAVSLLLKNEKVDINKAREKDGRTPLLCRLADNKNHDSDIIKLIAHKPDVNLKDSKGDGPLHLALRRFTINPGLINELLAAGANPNSKNAAGNTPLHQAGNRLSQKIIKSLLQAGGDLEVCNNKGQSVLFAQLSPGKGIHDKFEILNHLAGLGARLDTRDHKGRTLWHCAIDCTKTLSLLKDLGLDPLVSDHDGNTPLYEVLADKSLYRKREVLSQLVGMGMDIDKPNHRGRTLLHLVCSRYLPATIGWESVDQIFDYILEQSKCLTARDQYGIQALHIAATISESFVNKLLNAGANICAVTNDKITILHLAARARQSGIVGMVLSRAKSLPAETRLGFVNAQDEEGRSALHYACRSGRPETVKLLLEAGAALDVLDINKHSPLAMCGEFEKEASLWIRYMPSSNPSRQQSERALNAAGLTLKDTTRPFFDRADDDTAPAFGRIQSEHDTTRLTEIVNLLVKYGVDLESDEKSLEYAWRYAAQPEYGYTLSCLPPLPDRPSKPRVIYIGWHREMEDPDKELKILIAKNYRKALKETLETNGKPDEGTAKGRGADYATSLRHRSAEKALALRYYDLFESLSGGRDLLHVADYHGNTSLDTLARWGFVELLGCMCTRETAAQLDGIDWTTNPNENDLKCSVPLGIAACERQLPNMDVLKLVVEDFGVNINAKRTQRIFRDLGHHPTICNGVLHDLALGKFWWHVNEALPYLIRMGADINIRNREGKTPLIVALKSDHPFSKEASQTLIRAGVDVNAVDTEGNTCLSIAADDMSMTKLLLAYGAKVSPSAFLSALKLQKIELLETFLSQSKTSMVNQPLPNESTRTNELGNFKTVGVGALPLLFTAACGNFEEDIDTRKQLMEILLKHGADPYSTFEQQQYQVRHRGCSEEPKDFPVITATLIHELLTGGGIVDPIFKLQSLDLECRDENGCTLILAASKSCCENIFIRNAKQRVNAIDPLPELIRRGANVMVQDNEGRTILHHSASYRTGSLIEIRPIREAFQGAMATNPGLVNQTDNKNETALHYALRVRLIELVNFLLDNGADPLQPDRNGDTGLHHLAIFDYKLTKGLLERFVAAGVDINARNKIGETPLFNLLRQKNGGLHGSTEDQTYNSASFQYFLECGANVFARSNDGSTLLHLLAGDKIELEHRFQYMHPGSGRVGVARFKRLMDMGLDPMAEDQRQRTSIDVAAACENELILRLFKKEAS